MTGRYVTTHAQHEQKHPDEAAYARQADPDREFPCPGTIRVVDQTEHHLILACDACRYETTCLTRTTVNQTAPF